MLVDQKIFEHPVRRGRIRVTVYAADAGYLVTEDRDGASRVFATLGHFESKDAALARAAERAAELDRQACRRLPAPS